MTTDNEQRAHWAAIAVDAFAKETGMSEEDGSTCIQDLITDLQHLCYQCGLDWEEITRIANANFEAELEEDL
jgi:hypothetical protein